MLSHAGAELIFEKDINVQIVSRRDVLKHIFRRVFYSFKRHSRQKALAVRILRVGFSQTFTSSSDSKLESLFVGVLEGCVIMRVIDGHKLVVYDLSTLL